MGRKGGKEGGRREDRNTRDGSWRNGRRGRGKKKRKGRGMWREGWEEREKEVEGGGREKG